MKPRSHQIEGAEFALSTIRSKGLAYLAWQERTGKTLTALLTMENSAAESVLIITKKKAISGWEETLSKWSHETLFVVINYESCKKIKDKFDAVILDEAHHAISGIGRRSKTWKAVRKHTHKKPILYLSATPYAEHLGLIEPQLALSDWSPFKRFKTWFDWNRVYGIPDMTMVRGRLIDKRDKYKDSEILEKLEPYFNFKTRKDVGIEVEPTVRVIEVILQSSTKKLMKTLVDDSVIEIQGETILADSDMKKRIMHYQLEGGTLKLEDTKFLILPNIEKMKYIQSNYTLAKIAIMAHFIAERKVLQEMFPNTLILSSDGDAEGVDLSEIDKLIVYSMSFKTSKHTQRIARQANHNRVKHIVVDILVGDSPAIGSAVYDTVAVKKENFIKNSYERAIK